MNLHVSLMNMNIMNTLLMILMLSGLVMNWAVKVRAVTWIDMDERKTSSTSNPPESFLLNSFSEPLYSGANISICATYCAIMEFSSSACLPYSSTEKLLTLLQLLCPPDSKLPSSMYKLKQFFRSFSTEYQKIEICSGCGQELPADHTCPQETKKNSVVHLPIQSSLQALTQSKWRDRACEWVNRVEGKWVGEWMKERS